AAAFKAGEKLGRRSADASKQELAYKTLQLESRLLGPWVDEIDALPRPQGQEQDAGKFIADMRDLADLLGRTATAIKQNDAATGKALVKQITAKTASARSEARPLDIEKGQP